MNEPVIVLNELTKSYGRHRGVEGISFSVCQGEIFGFIGPNGAGKSTTIRALIYGVDGHRRMEELAGRFNLDLSRRIGDLSLGNKKKVGIVSALLPSPKLLIMDEPTSGLDPLIQQTFYDLLKEENEHGTTIFLSSHVLSEVQRLCDRVAILREGKLVGVQSMKTLRENGYKKISLTAKSAIPEDFFSIPGTANFEQDKAGTSVSFMFNGSSMTIMEKLHQLELEDILIE